MKTYPLTVEPEAELDLRQAFAWYEDQRIGLDREFLQSVEVVFDRIGKTPELHAIAYRDIRRTLMKRFPFVVCYTFDEEKINVLGVFHGHRDPSSWQRLARK